MKRVLFIFISLMICVSGYSQKHMKFQGIEIDGTKKEFVDQLIKKGYRYEYENSIDNAAVLSGTFTGKKAEIYVNANSADNDVSSVIVDLPESTKWKSLLIEYNYYKDLYSQKYGMPVEVNEKDKTISDDNHWKIKYLVDGKNEWECWFETKDGEILLEIRGIKHDFGDDAGCITIMYRDKANFKKNQNKDIDDI